MPFRLEWKRAQVVFHYLGLVTSDDILSSNREVYGDARFDDLRWEVVLFDKVTRVEYTKNDVKMIAYLDRAAYRSNPNIMVLFVGDSELLENLHKEYAMYENEQFWPIFHMESRDGVWKHIDEAMV